MEFSEVFSEVLGIWSPQPAVPVMLEPKEKISDRSVTL
jgi:hypothetical protein